MVAAQRRVCLVRRTFAGVEREPLPPRETNISVTAAAGRLSAPTLRLACGCASCKEVFTGHALLDEREVSEDGPGNYAVLVVWDDGHRSLYACGGSGSCSRKEVKTH